MWDWVVWGSLAVGVIATLGALAQLVVRGLRAWRDVKRVRRHVVSALDGLASAGEAVADKAASLPDETGELTASLERLRGSLAQLAVLRAAMDEVQDRVSLATALAPRR